MEGKSVEEYLEVLYPGSKDSPKFMYFEKEYDKAFIEKNIDAINKYFIRVSDNKEFYGKKWQKLTDMELMAKSVEEAKIRYYYDALNPEVDIEEDSSYNKLTQDVDFIYQHLQEFENKYLELLKLKNGQDRNFEDRDLLEKAFRETKANVYFGMFYQANHETVQLDRERYKAIKDLEFINENIEEIDQKYREIMYEKLSHRRIIDTPEEEIMKSVINMVKTRILSENENKDSEVENKEEEANAQKDEGIEELLNNFNIDGNDQSQGETAEATEEEQEQEKTKEEGNDQTEEQVQEEPKTELSQNTEIEEKRTETNSNGANSYDIEIPTKQVLTSKDLANADMNAELTTSEVAKKKNFIRRIIDKIKSSNGR